MSFAATLSDCCSDFVLRCCCCCCWAHCVCACASPHAPHSRRSALLCLASGRPCIFESLCNGVAVLVDTRASSRTGACLEWAFAAASDCALDCPSSTTAGARGVAGQGPRVLGACSWARSWTPRGCAAAALKTGGFFKLATASASPPPHPASMPISVGFSVASAK